MSFKILTLPLPCILTEDELRERGDSLATLTAEIDVKEDEKKASAKAFKDELDGMNERALILSKAITTKTEERPIECRKEYNLKKGVWKIVRMDTAEVVEAGTMTEEERHMGKSIFDNPEES